MIVYELRYVKNNICVNLTRENIKTVGEGQQVRAVITNRKKPATKKQTRVCLHALRAIAEASAWFCTINCFCVLLNYSNAM